MNLNTAGNIKNFSWAISESGFNWSLLIPPSTVRIVCILILTWSVIAAVLVFRIQTYGAFTSVGVIKTLKYVQKYAGAHPDSVRLNQSYSQWALALNGTDASNYLKTGIGFAEGHGISLKDMSPSNPVSTTYIPNYYQAPGASFLIGVMIKLFGEKQILPYFILISFTHLGCGLLAAFLASRFLKSEIYIIGAGVLSLLCFPALSFNFGLGIFCGEPFANLFIGAALVSLKLFKETLHHPEQSNKKIIVWGICFGLFLALAAYFRDIYTTFAQFSLAVFSLYALVHKARWKQIMLFVFISTITLNALEYPWEKRNQKLFNEFTMSGSTYYGYALWYFIWSDYKESKKWACNAGHGIGNYLAPEKSAEVLARLEQNKKTGSLYALKCLVEAVSAKPFTALQFKLKAYRTLWFGNPKHWLMCGWCVISTILFMAYLIITRFKFMPTIWLFPLFLLCLSPLIHYELRYSQPFYFYSTPIAAMLLISSLRRKSLDKSKASKEKGSPKIDYPLQNAEDTIKSNITFIS